jgi:hypothetical protein
MAHMPSPLLPYLSFSLIYYDDAQIHGIMDNELQTYRINELISGLIGFSRALYCYRSSVCHGLVAFLLSFNLPALNTCHSF